MSRPRFFWEELSGPLKSRHIPSPSATKNATYTKSLKKALDPYLFTKIMDDYLTNIRDRITDTYDGKRDRHIMIRGINQFAD